MERTEKVRKNEWRDLPFASGLVLSVDLAQLQSREQQLDGGARVAIWPGVENLDPQPLDDGLRLGRLVVWRVVPVEHGVLSPPWLLQVQCPNEVM